MTPPSFLEVLERSKHAIEVGQVDIIVSVTPANRLVSPWTAVGARTRLRFTPTSLSTCHTPGTLLAFCCLVALLCSPLRSTCPLRLPLCRHRTPPRRRIPPRFRRFSAPSFIGPGWGFSVGLLSGGRTSALASACL